MADQSGYPDSVTMVRNGRTIRLYVCLPEGWLSWEVRRDSHGSRGAAKVTFIEARCVSRERAREKLRDTIEDFRRAGWYMG